MNITSNELKALLQLVSQSPQSVNTLAKLVSIDVLKSLGNSEYLVSIDNKQLTAHSDKNLPLKSQMWAEVVVKENLPHISKLITKPTSLTDNTFKGFHLNEKEFVNLLHSKEPLTTHKNSIVEHLSHANSKEEFINLSGQLLALNAHTLQIPLQYRASFGLLQMKKRYNDTKKKTSIDFYAALHHLGPISGSIMMLNETIKVHLEVAFKSTQHYLEHDLNFLPEHYHLTIVLSDTISSIFEPTNSAILDVSI